MLSVSASPIAPRMARSSTLSFPHPLHAPSDAIAIAIRDVLGPIEGSRTLELDDAAGARIGAFEAPGEGTLADNARALQSARRMPTVATLLDGDDPIGSTGEAYLKLHLLELALRHAEQPDLDGIFAALPTSLDARRWPSP